MRLFSRFKKRLSYLKPKQIEQIRQAFLFAEQKHHDQKRSSGESYITHPIAVAIILADMHMDPDSISAALLHDVIEDTPIEKTEIKKKFGKTVAELVDGVTKLTKMQFSTLAEAQAESFRKMVMAMSHDIRVILIKLADRLHNMRTMESLPIYKQHRIAKETLDIYAPIANRIGIHDLYIDLESLSFAVLYPRRHAVIQNAVQKARGNRKEIINTITKEIKKRFSKSALKKVEIFGREKHIYSIYKKMLRKHLSLSEIMDVYGFRIIVKNFDDCYRALGVIHSIYKPVPGRFKDYIAIPKLNGYQSLHTTLIGPQGLPIEIQIRTDKMEQIASKGIAAHWLYKTGEKFSEAHIRAQQWINDLLEMQQKTGSSLEFIENVKTDLFPEEIYVFTPKGGIMELPRGSTAIDFAYAVHTAIGNTCVAAKIDRQFAPLSTILTSGQTVAITTSPGSRPNPAWLHFVRTGKARSGIRHFLKNQQQAELITLGEQLLLNSFAELSVSFNKITKNAINKVLTEFKIEDLNGLFKEIGLGNRSPLFVAHQLINATKAKLVTKERKEPLLIQGTEGIAVNLAHCCHPIPGDTIISLMVKGRGLMVHREQCEKISRLRKQPEKFILARWADDIKEKFVAILKIDMSSRLGSFAALTKAIADCEANIDNITIIERTGAHYVTKVVINVRNKTQVEKVLNKLNSLSIVTKAIRV